MQINIVNWREFALNSGLFGARCPMNDPCVLKTPTEVETEKPPEDTIVTQVEWLYLGAWTPWTGCFKKYMRCMRNFVPQSPKAWIC